MFFCFNTNVHQYKSHEPPLVSRDLYVQPAILKLLKGKKSLLQNVQH